MRKSSLVVLLATLALHGVAIAGLSVVERPSVRFGNRFCFVVDVSGSLDGAKMDKALDGFGRIAQQSTDEMRMAVLAFDNGTRWWPGVEGGQPACGTPKSVWVPLPDSKAVPRAKDWLRRTAKHGGTVVGAALERALAEREKVLVVVLITDGSFYQESPESIKVRVAAAQKRRVSAGLGRATISVVDVGTDADREYRGDLLLPIAKGGRGGLYRVD